MIETIKMYILLFFIYAVAGWIMESTSVSIQTKKWVNRGFLIGPICPIYGYGASMVTIFLSKYQADPIITFCMSVIICGALEYFTSFAMEKLFNARWWDYSDRKFNINGRICLENLVLFGIGCCLVIYGTNPWLIQAIGSIPDQVQTLLIAILLALHITDNVISYHIIFNLKQVSNEIKDNTIEISEKVKHIIYNKSTLYRRLVNAFPDVKEKVDFARWNIKGKLEKMKEEVRKK